MEQSGPSPNQNPREAKAHFSKDSIVPVIFALLLLGYCLDVCVIPPRIGMADSGDYMRLMKTIGVKHSSDVDSENYHIYFQQFYSRNEDCPLLKSIRYSLIRFPASIFTGASLLMNALFGTAGSYNIIYLGILYSFAYSLAFFFLIRALARGLNVYYQIILCLTATLVFADSLFVVYLNSFYQEPVFLILLLTCVAVHVGRSPKSPVRELSIFCLSLSKFQNIIFSAFYVLPVFSGSRRIKLTAVLLILSLAVTAVGSREYQRLNVFRSFFTGLLANNPEKDQVLSDFGVNRPEYSRHVEKYWWLYEDEATTQEMIREFYSKVSVPKITFYYIRHPKMLISNFMSALEYIRSTDPSPDDLGNYTQEYATGMKRYTGINLFSRFMPYLFIAIPFLSFIAMPACLSRRLTREFLLIALLLAVLPLTVIVCLLGEGFTDLTKHLFSFYSLLSVLCVVSLGNLLRCIPPAVKA